MVLHARMVEGVHGVVRTPITVSRGRRVLIVDGVGFPAVGSIVGVDNADVAKAARAPVLLVCKSGVGGAIDSFNLNCCYFASKAGRCHVGAAQDGPLEEDCLMERV